MQKDPCMPYLLKSTHESHSLRFARHMPSLLTNHAVRELLPHNIQLFRKMKAVSLPL